MKTANTGSGGVDYEKMAREQQASRASDKKWRQQVNRSNLIGKICCGGLLLFFVACYAVIILDGGFSHWLCMIPFTLMWGFITFTTVGFAYVMSQSSGEGRG